jgi:nucleoside-diphosphate-sugar epimerase
MKALFIGGSGILSSATVAAAFGRGLDVTIVNRGVHRALRPWPDGVRVLLGDVREPGVAERLLGNESFDVVVDFIAFEPDHAQKDIQLFSGRTDQFIYISSASVYRKPILKLPIFESTPTGNTFWPYSQNKLACEEVFTEAYRNQGFPITIVRPSHTYDRTLLPFSPHGSGATYLSRMKRGLPIVIHGDGTSLWTLTHHTDFAAGLVGLFGNPATKGEVFHITSDETIAWNEVVSAVARALRVDPHIVHVPSRQIAKLDPEWGASLLGDKAHSVQFDNSKIRAFVPGFRAKVPFFEGAREAVEYFESDPELTISDPRVDSLLDHLVQRFS